MTLLKQSKQRSGHAGKSDSEARKLCKFVSRSVLALDADHSLDFKDLSLFSDAHLVLQCFRQKWRISVFALSA